MGWSGGGCLMDRLLNSLLKNVSNYETRKHIYTDMIDAFEDHDWDNSEECLYNDPAYDAALKKLHPSWFKNKGS